MNGLAASDHIGHRPDELLQGVTGLDRVLERWRAIIETGESWLNVELRGETAAQPGIARSWSENFFPVRVCNKVVGLGAVVEETTARDRVRDALVASEARFRGLIEIAPVGISIGRVGLGQSRGQRGLRSRAYPRHGHRHSARAAEARL